MATRDLTRQYLSLRATRRGGSVSMEMGGFSQGGSSFSSPSVKKEADLDVTKPRWMQVHDQIKNLIVEIKGKMEELDTLHHKSFLVKEFDSSDSTNKVEVKTDNITSLFGQCQKMVLSLFPRDYQQYLTDSSIPLPVGETYTSLQIRKNIQQDLSSELSDLSQQFRTMQRTYLQKLEGKESSSSSSDAPSAFDEPEIYTRGFTEQQEEAVAHNQINIQGRLNEIKNIAQSINRLAQMFQEMHMMVVEQGTLLDRVDQNLVQARQQTQEAVKELTTADKHDRAAQMKLCILLLVMLIVACVICLIIFKVIPINKD